MQFVLEYVSNSLRQKDGEENYETRSGKNSIIAGIDLGDRESLATVLLPIGDMGST